MKRYEALIRVWIEAPDKAHAAQAAREARDRTERTVSVEHSIIIEVRETGTDDIYR